MGYCILFMEDIRMTGKRFTVDGMSYEEYLRRNPMPTRTLDTEDYMIVEVRKKE